jgi:hypothetical protein
MGEKRTHRGAAQVPLVMGAALFVLGVVLAREGAVPMRAEIGGALGSFVVWIFMEARRMRWAGIALAASMTLAGAALWNIDQEQVERMHVAWWVPPAGDVPVAARMRVLVEPREEGHGNRRWVGRVTEIMTTGGWRTATGDVLVAWRRAGGQDALRRGEIVEVYGWASRPPGALNPGGIDRRTRLAADRIFVEVRVPRAGGVVRVDAAGAHGVGGRDWLTAGREWLRGKLLEHTVQEDVPAAYALTALVLGYRDATIAEVSQAFVDAGVAHLLRWSCITHTYSLDCLSGDPAEGESHDHRLFIRPLFQQAPGARRQPPPAG